MYEKFQELLDKYGKTAAQVSKETGVASSTLSEWKKGKYTPKSVAIKSMDKFKWIATYDNSNEIKNIYNDRNIYEYKLQYFANKTRKETELLFCSNNTIIQPFGNVEFPI